MIKSESVDFVNYLRRNNWMVGKEDCWLITPRTRASYTRKTIYVPFKLLGYEVHLFKHS